MLKGVGDYRVQGSPDGKRKISRTAGIDYSKAPQQAVQAGLTQGTPVKAGMALPAIIGGAGSTTGNSPVTSIQGQYYKPILDGMIGTDEKLNRTIYRDIYYNDAIAGSAVDLLAQIPFSSFSLSGLPDQNMTDVYADSCEALNVPTLFPELTVSYLVDGQFIASFNYDDDTHKITSIIPQDSDNCTITPVPAYGNDPIIDVNVPQHFAKFVDRAQKDPRFAKLLNAKLDDLIEMVKNKAYPLDPEYTLFIPRRTFPTNVVGTSFYKRIVPAWLLEKALWRGTIDLSMRRQKSVMHIMAGDEEWEPTDQQLSQLVQLFLQADLDPTGAIVATRPGIMTQEVRMATDFWKVEDSYSLITDIKLRGLNISEAFITGDAVLTTMDTSLSVMLEVLRNYRDMVTRKVFYQKVFPLIARENNFQIQEKRYEVTASARKRYREQNQSSYTFEGEYHRIVGSSNTNFQDRDFDPKQFYMPKITWHKSLKPEADQEYIGILNDLADKGLPVTLRMLAVAAGLSLPEIMAQLEDDIKVRNKVADYQKRLPKTMQQQAEEMGFGAMASTKDMGQVLGKFIAGNKGPAPKKNRDFSYLHEQRRDPDTGRRVITARGRRILDEQVNKQIANLMAKTSQKENDKLRRTGQTR